MDDIGVIMTPFGDVVTVILVVNSYVLILQSRKGKWQEFIFQAPVIDGLKCINFNRQNNHVLQLISKDNF